jgi:DNA modification methylase
MTKVYERDGITILHGDCIEVLRTLPDSSVDSVCCDPPYGLEFMGKEWDAPWKQAPNSWADRDAADHAQPENRGQTASPFLAAKVNKFAAGLPFQQWCELWATECLRVLKPGGHLLAFGGTRTWHRLACAVEDAGFEVRDSIAWLYGSGFPKSLDVSKAIDRSAGAQREVVGQSERVTPRRVETASGFNPGQLWRWGDEHWTWDDLPENGRAYFTSRADMRGQITAPATPDAERWQGWGTALKPAFEPVVVARKPLSGTVAQTVLAHGTGALNVDACRIGDGGNLQRPERRGKGDTGGWAAYEQEPGLYGTPPGAGRWPANVVLDETQADALDQMSGETVSSGGATGGRIGASGILGEFEHNGPRANAGGLGDVGGASRFFHVAKDAPEPHDDRAADDLDARAERSRRTYYKEALRDQLNGDAATPSLPIDQLGPRFNYVAKADASERVRVNGTAHPTVKPLALMRWLVRLVTPPGGTVLEPFAGSGTTVEACILEGFSCIAIEREAEYLPLIQQRINRRRDPVAYYRAAQPHRDDKATWVEQNPAPVDTEDGGLFDLLDGGAA